jgi:hypothetical protein
MPKELIEIAFPDVSHAQHHASLQGQGEPIKVDTVHDLQYVRDERGMVKFRSRKTGIHYFQAPGNIWYAEVEDVGK